MRPIDLSIKRVVHAETKPADLADRIAVATHIWDIERENAKLREALERIATFDAPDAHAMIQQAKVALGR